jgi:hypothetical protein
MSGGPDEDNIFQWKAYIAGPKTTPFEVSHNDGVGTKLPLFSSGGQNDDFRPLTYTLGGRGMGCRDKYVTS